ncbi:hypothetical protein [Belliella pelovolcani]|uniref:DUF4856 domain-containing protein n=1 Tax=Belliella pelovolcani TaxID=529505 RepID=A0A1N7M2X0_9BACT|nr:hypothetical protein [Belliella pelovolcani]SIS80466.1 hypothetical protein SAMN05421761_10548 [Belliella pelovolcani]
MRKLLPIAIFIAGMFFGCSAFEEELFKENDLNNHSIEQKNRLKFNSYDSFTNAISEIGQNSNANSKSIIEKYAEKPEYFNSLKSLIDSESFERIKFRTNSENNENLNPELYSEMVPDLVFAELLNENLEIEVENVIFKITPFGTFFSRTENYGNLIKIVDDFKISKLEDLRNTKNTNARMDFQEPSLYEDAYLLEDDVYLFDTYYDYDFDDEIIFNVPNVSISSEFYQLNNFCGVCAPVVSWALPDSEYNKFQEYSFGRKTDVGKLMEGIVGNNKGFTLNFSDNYRLKAKLYAFNYWLYQSVGVKGKMQKRGWTGFWAKHKDSRADKLVVGWDVMLFNINHPISLDLRYTQLPSKKIAKEILKFSNFDMAVASLSDARLVLGNVQLIDYNDLEKALNGTVKLSLAKLTEKVWKEAEKSFATASYEITQERIKTYRKIFPNKTKMMLSRFEAVLNNSNEINLNIDRQFRVSYNNQSGDGFYENLIIPTLGQKKMYDIEGASVYAAAQFRNQIKGIRITKEIND